LAKVEVRLLSDGDLVIRNLAEEEAAELQLRAGLLSAYFVMLFGAMS